MPLLTSSEGPGFGRVGPRTLEKLNQLISGEESQTTPAPIIPKQEIETKIQELQEQLIKLLEELLRAMLLEAGR